MQSDVYDVVMIGAGPASLTAAIYTGREDLKTLILEKSIIGGIPATIDVIDNYPGFAEGVPGLQLAEQMQKQAERFGAAVDYCEVTCLKQQDGLNIVQTAEGDVKTKAVLIGTGSAYKKLNIPGEQEFYANGVHYCATCDGAFYKDQKIVVVGGGNAAVQESIFLTRYASHIDLLVRSTVKASEVLQKHLQKYVDEGKITVHLGAVPTQIVGGANGVTGIEFTQNGDESSIQASGVFVFIGLVPNTAFLQNCGVKLDDQGFVVTDDEFMTDIKGVFAAGDVRSGAIMQIATSVGEGAAAAIRIREYLSQQAFEV